MTKSGDKAFVSRKDLDEAVDTILSGINNLFEASRQERNSRLDKVEGSLKAIEGTQREIKVALLQVKDEINGLKADLSDTPSRKEFENLKTRVDEQYPLS